MHPAPGGGERTLVAAVAAHLRAVTARVDEAEREGRLPPDVIRGLADIGVLGMSAPEEDGGLGASAVAFALVLEEIASVWPSLAVAVSVSSGLVTGLIARTGTGAQRVRWLPALRDGRGLGAFALTEPEAGSDAAALRASAVPDGDGWRLRGQKTFITNASVAPVVIVFARIGGAVEGRPHAGITAFLVPVPAEGLRIERPERKMGLHASQTCAIALEDVRVGADAVLGEPGRGFSLALAALDRGRIGIAAQAVGIARGALERAVAYAARREQFGRTIASFGSVRSMLGRSKMEIDAARLLALRAAWRSDTGVPFTAEAAMAKLYATEAAQRVTHAAVQIHGGYGYVRELGVERLARDARATTLFEGTSEIQRLVIARGLIA